MLFDAVTKMVVSTLRFEVCMTSRTGSCRVIPSSGKYCTEIFSESLLAIGKREASKLTASGDAVTIESRYKTSQHWLLIANVSLSGWQALVVRESAFAV